MDSCLYAARAGLSPVVITGTQVGGQLNNHRSRKLARWRCRLQGPQLMVDMQAHAERFDTQVINDHIHTADLSKSHFS